MPLPLTVAHWPGEVKGQRIVAMGAGEHARWQSIGEWYARRFGCLLTKRGAKHWLRHLARMDAKGKRTPLIGYEAWASAERNAAQLESFGSL